MSAKSLAILGILFLFLLFTISTAQRSSYGETCNKTQRCDRRSWLGCISGKCACLKPDEMFFEPSTGKCASKAGERCKYSMEDSDESRSFEYTSCVKNSICGDDGFCACAEDFYEEANGTCSATRKFTEPCNDRAKCSTLARLVCNNGVCGCSDGTSLYSSEAKQCVGLAGHVCILSKCIENANCTSNRCICKEGYYQNGEDGCSRRLDMDGNCTSDDQCKYEGGFLLKCINGSCKCDPFKSIFGTAKKTEQNRYSCDFRQFTRDTQTHCLGKRGHPCIEGFCAFGSYCQGSCGNKCDCLPGYVPSAFGTCALPYDSACSSAGTCNDGLVCKRDKRAMQYYNEYVDRCKCRYSEQAYDSEIRKCVSSVGSPCDEFTACVDRAECVGFKGSSKGVCQCQAGYVENGTNSCEVAYGMPCSSSTPKCQVVAGLNCIENICECEGFKEFDPQSKLCLGLVGAKCTMNATSQECVQNSKCLKTHERHTFGKCTCSKGYGITSNFTCALEEAEVEKKAGGDAPVLDIPEVLDDLDDSNHCAEGVISVLKLLLNESQLF